jgi:hypothetical protein
MFKAQDSFTKLYIDAEYIIDNTENKLFNDAWEELELISNKTYTLTALKEGYYFGQTKCYVDPEVEDNKCIVELDPHGTIDINVNKINNSRFSIKVNINDGYIKDPMMCLYFPYFSNIRDAKLDLEELPISNIPFEIKYKYDHCYFIEKNIKKIRDPPLTKPRAIKELKNFLDNCTEHEFKLNKTKAANIIDNPCNTDIDLNNFLDQFRSFYNFCYEFSVENQRAMVNSIISYYEECEEKKGIVRDIELNINYYYEPKKNDSIRFLILDKGDYKENKQAKTGYFGINQTDIGIKNYEYLLQINQNI